MKKLALIFFSLCIFQISNAQCDFDPTIDGELILCPNSTAILSTQVYDVYQWHKREYSEPTLSPIPGDTSQTISINNPGDVLYYFSVEATLDGCTEFSPEVLVDGWLFLPVTVASTGDFTIGNNGETIVCIGDTMYFTINLPYNKNITWYKNGNPIPGETTTVLTITEAGQYTVTGAPSVCPDYVQSLGLTLEVLFIECTTGLNEELTSNGSVLIFPNPTFNQITIKSEDEEILDISIYNSVGQLIRKELVSGRLKIMNVSGLASGVYFFEVSKTTGKEQHMIIIK